MARILRRARGERGAAAVEYVGVIVVVGLLLATISFATLRADLGYLAELVGCRIVEPVTGVGCGNPFVNHRYRPCRVAGREDAERLSATVAFVTFGRGDVLRVQHLSDGSWTVDIVDEGSVGARLLLGANPGLNGVSAGDAAASPVLAAQLAFTFVGGRSFRFDSRAEMRRFVDRHSGPEGLAGELKNVVIDAVTAPCGPFGGCDVPFLAKPELPRPDVRYLGAEASALAELELGGAGGRGLSGRLRAAAAAAAGVRIDRNGSTTLVQEARVGGSARARLLAPVTAAASAQGEIGGAYELTLRDGRPARLVIRSRSLRRAGAGLGLAISGPSAAAEAARRLQARLVDARGALVVEERRTVPLRNTAARATAVRLMLSAASPAPGEAGAAQRAALRLAERIGTVDLAVRSLVETEREWGAAGGRGLGLGFKYGRTAALSRLLDAESRLPGRPFVKRWDCLRAA